MEEGLEVGVLNGSCVGFDVGDVVGLRVGLTVGKDEGLDDGDLVGRRLICDVTI